MRFAKSLYDKIKRQPRTPQLPIFYALNNIIITQVKVLVKRKMCNIAIFCNLNKKYLFISYNLPIANASKMCYTKGEENEEVQSDENLNPDALQPSDQREVTSDEALKKDPPMAPRQSAI